jgi:hypothetical protein
MDDFNDMPDAGHRRPDGVSDGAVEALGSLSEALEAVEYGHGLLYGFHRLAGTADSTLATAIRQFRDDGSEAIADRLEHELLGRNVLSGQWTFQVVEEYDDGYYSTFKRIEADARRELVGGRRHLHEAEMKEAERTRGRSRHEARPATAG